MSNVLISIASELNAKGFKDAQDKTSGLEKSANKLGKALLAAFSVKKLADFSKASIKAFAEDQKAAALLSNQLKNVGLAYASVDVEKFIKNLQAQTGILDDELRPAFSELARVTGSVAQSQKLMSLAFDVSRGSGVDFMTTVDALSKAYVGNFKGLKQLNIGLTDAELKGMKFADIMDILNQKFKGAGAASVDTFQGKLDKLNVAFADSKEIIGKGFVDAFSTIAKDQNFNDVTDRITNMAQTVADGIAGIGILLNKLDTATPPWLKAAFTFLGKQKGIAERLGEAARRKEAIGTGGSYFTYKANLAKAAAAEAAAAKRNAQLEKGKLGTLQKQTVEKKAQLAIDKANQVLGAAKNVFDLERISVAAAMANTTLTENERKRLEIKQAIFNLEDAIDSKDTARIDAATKILNGLVGQFSILQAQDSLLGKIKSAYDALGMNKDLINLNNLQSAYDLLLKMAGIKIGGFTAAGGGNIILNPPGGGGGITAGSTFDPGSFRWRDEGNTGNMPTLPSAIGATWDPAAFRRGEMGQPPIVIKVESRANDLVNFIYDTVTEQSASGNSPIVTRIDQSLAW